VNSNTNIIRTPHRLHYCQLPVTWPQQWWWWSWTTLRFSGHWLTCTESLSCVVQLYCSGSNFQHCKVMQKFRQFGGLCMRPWVMSFWATCADIRYPIYVFTDIVCWPQPRFLVPPESTPGCAEHTGELCNNGWTYRYAIQRIQPWEGHLDRFNHCCIPTRMLNAHTDILDHVDESNICS